MKLTDSKDEFSENFGLLRELSLTAVGRLICQSQKTVEPDYLLAAYLLRFITATGILVNFNVSTLVSF